MKYFLLITTIFTFGHIGAQNCANWLLLSKQGAYVELGDIDVEGTQLTVEAVVNRSQPLNDKLYPGHLVSKHTNAANSNYSLFPNGCAITTKKGYYATFEKCPLQLNTNYHVAMVYDGENLKFYRNGYLISSVACKGKLVLNNLATTVGQVSGGDNVTINQLLGFVNEVRIWNVARSQSQIKEFMNISLPNPSTQQGLQGYFIFDNLRNRQWNDKYNVSLIGGAKILEKMQFAISEMTPVALEVLPLKLILPLKLKLEK